MIRESPDGVDKPNDEVDADVDEDDDDDRDVIMEFVLLDQKLAKRQQRFSKRKKLKKDKQLQEELFPNRYKF